MTASKHTPGPWHMDPEEITSGFRIVPKIGDRGLAVAIQRDAAPAIPGSGIDRATAEANARLIAAAPELLEALEEMVKAGEFEDWDGRCDCIAVARAAIAKATGGAA